MSKCPCGFCHLHVHSEYSLLDGANRIKDMAKRAAAMDMPALAITDHGVMYGAIDHYEACVKEGIKPIIGCCLPGQLIYTTAGVKPIEEIEVGEMVLTHEGRYRPVVRTMTRNYSGTIYGVRAANANTVWLTDEHPIWLSVGQVGKKEWVRADELSSHAGRKVQSHRGALNWNSYAVFPRVRHEKMQLLKTLELATFMDAEHYEARDRRIWKRKSWNKYDREEVTVLPAELEVTPMLADLLGLFVAEGSFSRDPKKRATTLVWSFGLALDKPLAARVVEAMKAIFGVDCTVRPREDKAVLEVLCCNTALARLFEKWCGSGAHHKKIPSFVYGASDSVITAFVRGLADGDGKIDKTGRVCLKMVSRDVVYGVRLLLSRLGIAGKASESNYDGHRAFHLNWNETVAYRRFQSDESYLYLPLKEVSEKDYDGPVYNLEVLEDHSYVTDIVLHNCEAYVAPRKHTDKDSQLDGQKSTRHLTLWAKNKQGYENLVKLTTRAHLDGFYYKPRVDHELLAKHSEGIICGSACLGGEVPQLIMGKKFDEAVERAEMYQDMFGKGNYFLELMDHDLTGQAEVNDRIIDIHHKTGIPLICTNDSHYLEKKDEEMHKILVAIGTNSQIDSMALHYGPNFYLKDKEEMWSKFKHVPEALENTLRIADMVDLELDLKTTHFPNFDVPAGHDKVSYLKQLCKERFDKRYPVGHAYRAEAIPRMEYELKVIIDKGYPGYFLVVQDFINWSKERGILVGCRGSAAGCLVSYVLGITNLDPLPYGLLFERFLNPDRVSMPDIDVDFPDKRREEVMTYVTDKYGKDKVAQIITFGTLAARASVKDTARATGLDLKLADQVSKLIPAVPGQPMTIAKAIEEVKELGDLYANDSTVKRLLDRAQAIEGMTRHSSRHACGVVIGNEPLDTLVPLEEKDGLVVTQYHAKAVEKIGLVKMDFLGLTNNSVIDDTLGLIKERYNEDIDLETLDLNDKKVYDMMGRGDGIAVFQMEGAGMRNLLREMKPENLEHIIAQISLYRPGPMEEIPRYINGRHGGKVTYPHPRLEPILKNTYGMLLYQEQVMQAAQELAGFTGGQADELRGAMAKKKADMMAKLKPMFIEGCVKNRIDRASATDIFQRMEDFAKYAFNKCLFAGSTLRLADGSKLRLSEAYKKQPAEIMALWPDGEIRPHKVARIVKTGVKPLLKITTKKGRVVKATAEHRFLTTQGYLPVSDLEVGTELMTEKWEHRNLKPESREKRRENMRRINAHPDRQKWADECSERMTAYQAARPMADKIAHMKRMHEEHPDLTRAGVAAMHERLKWLMANDVEWRQMHIERSLASVRDCYDSGPGFGRCSIASNGMWCASNYEREMCEWLIAQNIEFEMHKVLPSGRICDFYFDGIYWEMDGMDRVAEYFEAKYGELPFVVVTPEDYKFKVEHHLQLAHAENGDPIVSIEPCGEGMTYDVEMAPDGPLNFIANGIVSHNSHAAYYGLVSYWTGYLKTNYTSEFLASTMTSRLDAKPKLLPVIEDARKHDIQVLPPDVNESRQDFTVVGREKNSPIRFGLLAIKGIGEGPVNAILEARAEGGKFISLHDFCERVPIRGCNKSCIETLIRCGAFDEIHPNRCALLEGLEGAIAAGARAQTDALTGQQSMFGESEPTESGRPKTMGELPDCEDVPREDRLAWEKEYIGLYVSDHPLNTLRDYLDANTTPTMLLTEPGGGLQDNSIATLGGLLTTIQRRLDKNGRPWAILTLEDLTGSTEILCFAKVWGKVSESVKEDDKVLITGRLTVDSRGGGRGDDDEGVRFKMMADSIKPIPKDAEEDSAQIAARNEMAADAAADATGNDENSSAPPADENTAVNSSGVKRHILLEQLEAKARGSNGGGSNGGGSNGGGSNGGGSNGGGNSSHGGGQSVGNGMSMNRSHAPSVNLPPASAPSMPPPQAPPTYGNGHGADYIPRVHHGFEPPSEAIDAVHLHVSAELATQDILHRLYNMCQQHSGATEVWLHLDNGTEMVQMKVSASFWVNADQQFVEDVADLLGADNVMAPMLG